MSPQNLGPEQWQKLLDRSNIVFERPINPRKWPSAYQKVFGVIRDISRQWMEDYVKNNDFDILPLREKQVRVADLVNSARDCVSTFKDEDDWRERTENKIFSRFSSEVICRECRNYLWSSDFELWPEDEAAAERQRHRRRKRRLCQCTLLNRSPADIGDDGGQPLFESVRQTGIDPEHIDGSGGEASPKKQRPDRVIGLNMTNTLADRIASDRLRTHTHTPFEGKNVLYPFLVVEAKREKGPGPGFTSIEHQTAFPIRTCLRLQQKLRQQTGVDMQCLVWFFAFRGEEWRLYGAVPDQDRTRVFDLWHGTILSEDGALQLCLIVDYICTWARNHYREQVLACLAAGSGLLRRFTSPLPSQFGDTDGDALLESGSLPLRLSAEPNLGNSHQPEPSPNFMAEAMGMTDDATNLESQSRYTFEGRDDAYSWSRFTPSSAHSPPWARIGTIRHANLVQFTLQELFLPEDGQLLRRCLTICFPESDIRDAANRILETLWNSFARSKTDSSEAIPGWNIFRPSVFTFIYLQTQLRPDDWQMERYVLLWLQVASVEGAEDWGQHIRGSLRSEFRRFNMLSGKEGAQLALSPLSQRQMCLKLCLYPNGEKRFETHGFCPGQLGQLYKNDLETIRRAITARRGLEGFMEEYSRPFRVPFHAEQPETPDAEPSRQDPREEPCMLIKKRPNWRRETAEFCLLALGEHIDFKDDAKLGSLIKDALDRSDVFGISGQIEDRDKSVLRQWSRILRGELPAGTQF